MKPDWLKETPRKITCKIVHNGIVRELLLNPLNDALVDAANREFPGEQNDESRGLYLAALALGPEMFDSADVLEQMKELPEENGGYSRAAIGLIVKAAIDVYTLTPEKMEAAKDGVRPTESAG